jgi:uncharacterized membrane protein
VFFAFSTFVMPALDRLRAPEAIRAMQELNRAAPNAAFMTVLFAPLIPMGWLLLKVARRGGPSAPYLVAGTACFALGLLILIAYHVPHNDALAKVSPASPSAASTWRDYYRGWTWWNHARTATFTAATALFALAARAARTE